MFSSLLPHTTCATVETASKLVDFCVCKSYLKNVVYSGATSLCGHQVNYKNRETHLPFTENSRSTYVSFENMKHISERDSYIMDILSEIIETSYATVPLSGRGGSKWVRWCRDGRRRWSPSDRMQCFGTVFG